MKHKKMQKKTHNGDENELSDHHEESDDVSYEDQSNLSDTQENATVPNKLSGYDVASLVTHHSLRNASQDVACSDSDGDNEEIDVVESDSEKS